MSKWFVWHTSLNLFKFLLKVQIYICLHCVEVVIRGKGKMAAGQDVQHGDRTYIMPCQFIHFKCES